MFNFLSLLGIKPKVWRVIETVVFQSPTSQNMDDPLVIQIEEHKGRFRKTVTKQVFEDDATEEDKNYYLTKYLMVLDYVLAMNNKEIYCPFKDFETQVERLRLEQLEIVEEKYDD